MKLISTVFFLILLFITGNLTAGDNSYEVTVKGKRKSNKSTATVEKVSARDIKRKQRKNVADAVKDTPGVFVSRSGGPGSITSIYVRGLRPEYVVVLADGIKLNNPIQLSGGVDFSLLSTDNVASIEIVRGAQTVIYGPDALAGVITIKTKRGTGNPKLTLRPEGGIIDISEDNYTPDTIWTTLGVRGKTGNFSYSATFGYFETKGISMADSFRLSTDADKEKAASLEKDGFRSLNGSARLDYDFGDLDLSLTARFGSGKLEIDDGPGIWNDDKNRKTETLQFFIRPEAKLSLFKGRWDQTAGVSVGVHSLTDDDPKDLYELGGDAKGEFDGLLVLADWRNRFQLFDWNEVRFGFEFQKAEGKMDIRSEEFGADNPFHFPGSAQSERYSLYIHDTVYPFKGAEISGGVRGDIERYDAFSIEDEKIRKFDKVSKELSYGAGASYFFEKTMTKLRTSFGKGSKNPSLFQLFTTYMGDGAELKPQTGYSLDGGVIQYLFEKKLKAEAVYFWNRVFDYIDYDYHHQHYVNRYKIDSQGFEFLLQVKPLSWLTLGANYTLVTKMEEYRLIHKPEAIYKESIDIQRMPSHMVNGSVNIHYRGFNFNVNGSYVGERFERIFNLPKTPYSARMDDYFLLNIAASYKINKYAELFGRVDNVLDNDDYAVVAEYGTPGISLYGGVKLSCQL